MQKPNESDASSNQSGRFSRSFREKANRVANNANEEAIVVENHAYDNADSDIIWKIMVFFLIGILLGI